MQLPSYSRKSSTIYHSVYGLTENPFTRLAHGAPGFSRTSEIAIRIYIWKVFSRSDVGIVGGWKTLCRHTDAVADLLDVVHIYVGRGLIIKVFSVTWSLGQFMIVEKFIHLPLKWYWLFIHNLVSANLIYSQSVKIAGELFDLFANSLQW